MQQTAPELFGHRFREEIETHPSMLYAATSSLLVMIAGCASSL